MRRAITLASVLVGLCVVSVGCTTIRSARGGNSGVANDVWFTETVGIPLIPFSTKVYYCPPMSNTGPSTCTEAVMVEDAKVAPQKASAPAPAAAQEEPPAQPVEEEPPEIDSEFPPG